MTGGDCFNYETAVKVITSEANQEEQHLGSHLHAEGNKDQRDANAIVVVSWMLVALWLLWNICDCCKRD